jgi:hypothetical protein
MRTKIYLKFVISTSWIKTLTRNPISKCKNCSYLDKSWNHLSYYCNKTQKKNEPSNNICCTKELKRKKNLGTSCHCLRLVKLFGFTIYSKYLADLKARLLASHTYGKTTNKNKNKAKPQRNRD